MAAARRPSPPAAGSPAGSAAAPGPAAGPASGAAATDALADAGAPPAAATRLAPGDRAPAFTLPDQHGAPVSLASLAGRRVLLYAYPAAGTPGCTRQACDFRDSLTVFADAGLTVVGLSPDPVAALARFAEQQALPFVLLSDPARRTLAAYGAYGPKLLYGRTVTGVIRSTVVVGPTGRVEHAFYNVKATGHVAKLLRDLRVGQP